MTEAATVEGSARVRLFCALRLPDEPLDSLVRWQDRALAGSRARVVSRSNLHVTLAFLGARPAVEARAIAGELRSAAAAAARPAFDVRGYRETRSVGMLVLGDEASRAAALAEELHGRLEALQVYRRESRPWLPHLTVIRFRERPRLRPELPDLGTFSPSDAALYTSVLRPGGAQYEVLESVPLGGG